MVTGKLVVRPKGVPSSSVVKKPPEKRHEFDPWVSKIPSRRKWQNSHSNILAWEVPWREEPGSYSPWGLKELEMT